MTVEIRERFSDIKDFIYTIAGSKHTIVRNIIKQAEKLVPLENVECIYVKNLYHEDEAERDFYFLSKESIYIISAVDSDIKIQVVKEPKIKDINLTIVNGNEDLLKLNIEFLNEVKMEFDSFADSNSNWYPKYSKLIKEIFEMYTS
ncbi:DUF3908 family protein [Bacillus anthracis]|uniref:DUF3908 family protein n=1 Tax=Bacillus cereus group TaxID=86661 RepID=UPI002270F5D5|nr:DUF3908 family protein [Bacillus anthracis]MCX9102961.1 DUF3908 family protein [Bacillus anthracis]